MGTHRHENFKHKCVCDAITLLPSSCAMPRARAVFPRSRSASEQKHAAGHLFLPNHIHNQTCSFSSLLLANEPSTHVQRCAILLKPQKPLPTSKLNKNPCAKSIPPSPSTLMHLMASPLNSQTLNQTNPEKHTQHPNQDKKKPPNDNLKAQALDMRMRSNSLLLRRRLHLLDLHFCQNPISSVTHKPSKCALTTNNDFSTT
jgi:hypothetical protein